MIKALINGIMSLVISLVNLILAPIDAVINSALPSLSEAFDYISGFFDTLGNVVPFVISYTGINAVVLNIIIDLFVFILSVPLIVHTIKLAIKWYNKLKV